MDEASRSCAGRLAHFVSVIDWLQTFTNNEFRLGTTNMSEAHTRHQDDSRRRIPDPEVSKPLRGWHRDGSGRSWLKF